jgi:hypothetical protein
MSHGADRIDSDSDARQSEKNESEKGDLNDDSEDPEWAKLSDCEDSDEDSEQHSNAITSHEQTGNNSGEDLEGAEESCAEEQTIHGKMTPAWYGDADKGLLRRRMGIKADLPLQQQNAIVRTLRKLVRTKCGSNLDKPWSTYGRTVQNRMINSMYNPALLL